MGCWLAAFLDSSVRKQAVGVDGRLSTLASVVSGVPQGTVLGPCLFLVHLLDISSNLSAGTTASSFVDEKFELLRFWPTREDPPDILYMAPDGSPIEEKETLRDLGVRVSTDLKFSEQINLAVRAVWELYDWLGPEDI